MIAGQRPDKIIANSKFVQNRIKKYWGRDSQVIYPPVEVFKKETILKATDLLFLFVDLFLTNEWI